MTDLSIHPTGGVFKEDGWKPSVEEIITFRQAVFDKGLSSCNLWSWDALTNNDWELLTVFSQREKLIEKPAPTLIDRLFLELNARNAENAVAFYDHHAKVATEQKVYQNQREIYDYFSTFFELSPHPEF